MTTPQPFRALVILEWLFIIAWIILSTMLEKQLPIELKQWIEIESESSTNDAIILFGGLPLLVASIVGSIGLYRLRKWGAWTYLISIILGYALYPFAGPSVEHVVAELVGEIAVIISGMIVAIAFFTDVLNTKQSVINTDNK